ncbi:MAG: ferrous iron transporter B [Pirellulales bacterium]|nr:ferrous iron transporter B [Pirellulales bacterium]
MPAAAKSVLTVALIGNPNTGKSTLFSALAGMSQHVANYPGATVEKKTGRMTCAGQRYELIDLPGLYSLSPRSRDEMVAVDVLLGQQKGANPVDAVICIVDAVNLLRNLYLVSQVRELGLPTVVAVNMLDVAAARSIALDLPRLERQLGVPVVGVQAHRRVGIAELKAALARAVKDPAPGEETLFPPVFEDEVARLQGTFSRTAGAGPMPAFLARRLLLDTSGYLAGRLRPSVDGSGLGATVGSSYHAGCTAGPVGSGTPALSTALQEARERLRAACCPIPAVEPAVRYAWAERMLTGALSEPDRRRPTVTDRIDHSLTHWFWGLLFFAAVMLIVFQSVFTWARPAMEAIEGAETALGGWLQNHLAEGALRSLLVGGVLSGVGSVLQFLPQILILFFFLGILEDCGYLARAAFLMDKFMARIGLSGKSFIPMLSCFACTVPGIMAARVIENERDRLTTILVAPLLTCSARLPVYTLLIAAFIPDRTYCGGLLNLQGLTLAGLYLLGIIVAVTAALVLKKTLLRGQSPPFVLELPSYKWPSLRTVVQRVLGRGWIFLHTAGTLILAVSILVWAGLYYPHHSDAVAPLIQERQQLQQQVKQLAGNDSARSNAEVRLREIAREIDGVHQRHSILGRLGHFLEPAVRPLGWDWRIGCAVIASLPAREVVVATMGVMYNAGEDEDNRALKERLRDVTWEGSGKPVFSIPTALSIMVFFALCAQCGATLAVMRRETNSWRWPAFTFAYMTVLAYLGALATYQVGTWLGG